MLGWQHLIGVATVIGLAPLALAPPAEASETYDNPTMGTTPCVILQSYQSSSNTADSFGAKATVENVCGRSIEVSFCFPFIAANEDIEPHCTNGLLRPWATTRIEVSDLPAKLANPNYHWRWHGHLMDFDR